MFRRFSVLCFVVLLVSNSTTLAKTQLRRPVAVSYSSGRIFAANRESGTVSVLNAAERSVVGEIEVGGRLADVVAIAPHRLIVLDEQHHQIILLSETDGEWKMVTRKRLASQPRRLVWDATTRRCFVTSLWSRTVSMLKVDGPDSADAIRSVATTRLRFEPNELCLSPDGGQVIVGDAFRAELAVIDTDQLKRVRYKKLPGHNIGGLAVDQAAGRLYLTQQELNPLARSTRDDVHWGNMISNLLVSLPLEAISRSEETDVSRLRIVHQLGEPGAAAGDPGEMTVCPTGGVVVLLSGVHQLAVGSNLGQLRRVDVGSGPASLAIMDPETVAIANEFDDSVSIVDLESANEEARIRLGEMPTLSLAEKGEQLFFDSRLSHDGWMSCHSCHTNGHSNDQLNDNLSDDSFAAPKRVLSLLGAAQTRPWAWNGGMQTLEKQVASSIEKTMQGTVRPSDVSALVAFLTTLESPPRIAELELDSMRVEKGRQLFRSLNCAKCHVAPTYTSDDSYDVGLIDEVGNRRFNPPSLRNVANRRSFFHDGRARSLAAVFTDHQHQLSTDLSHAELQSLLEFLQSL